ncbi:hypothetical protein ILFOPFJJ_03364 [Ensifer psoraleae]|nr:hypothetical protein [Sinorhizobium psoraleae]
MVWVSAHIRPHFAPHPAYPLPPAWGEKDVLCLQVSSPRLREEGEA